MSSRGLTQTRTHRRSQSWAQQHLLHLFRSGDSRDQCPWEGRSSHSRSSMTASEQNRNHACRHWTGGSFQAAANQDWSLWDVGPWLHPHGKMSNASLHVA